MFEDKDHSDISDNSDTQGTRGIRERPLGQQSVIDNFNNSERKWWVLRLGLVSGESS